MGSSADAYLVYGIDLGDEDTRSFELPEILENYDGLKDAVLAHLGLDSAWSGEYPGREFDRDKYRRNEDAFKAFGVDTQDYGYLDGFTAMAFHAIDSLVTAYEYGSNLVDITGIATPEKVAEYSATIDRALEVLELDLPDDLPRGWLLLASYG